jgi:DNA-binding beta-propeller fold protein YncE
MARIASSFLLVCCCALIVALCQQRRIAARKSIPDIPVLNYEHVNWPDEPTSVAGFPAGPWNFIQVPAVAVAANGNILLLHRGAYPIMEFEPGGKYVRAWGDGMFTQGKVVFVPEANRTPDHSYYSAVYGPAACTNGGVHSVRVDRQKNIWLVDATGHIVYKVDPQGKEILMRLGTQGVAGIGHNSFNLPTDVAFASNGDIYVSDDYGNSRMVKFSHDGKYLLEFGTRGSDTGEFRLPHNVVVDAQDRVYVTDRDNQRVEVFDSNGKYLKEWRTNGGVSTLFMTDDQHIWVGGVLTDLDGKVLGRLPFPNGGTNSGHGTVVTPSGDVYLAQLDGSVDKYVKK